MHTLMYTHTHTHTIVVTSCHSQTRLEYRWLWVNYGKFTHLICMHASLRTHTYTPAMYVMGAGVGCNEFVYKLL